MIVPFAILVGVGAADVVVVVVVVVGPLGVVGGSVIVGVYGTYGPNTQYDSPTYKDR